MSKCLKKICSFAMILILLLLSDNFAFAMNNQETNARTDIDNMVYLQTLEKDTTEQHVEKEFETIDEIEIEKDDYILIHYTIKNDSVTNELTLNAETKAAEKDGVINNVKIE